MSSIAKSLRVALIAVLLAAPAPAFAQSASSAQRATPPTVGGPHDFDFELGDWNCHLLRRLHPLTGSDTWVEYDGTSIVRPWWGGKANIGELDLDGSAGHLEGMSIRVYNPATHQWGISYANAAQGQVGAAMVGGFQKGRGEFYNQDTLNDRAIFVRFIFSDITAKSFQLEQAFSDDGGKTWESNWIAKFTR
ncbi:MAG: hypothetical protein JWP86_3196 [Phenylobacterium sp.]|nr:hypothetical protein [Phenylobacterium sp.]